MQPATTRPTACNTCRFDEIRRYVLAGRRAESRGCWHHIVAFPAARECLRYEREPGSDDELAGRAKPDAARAVLGNPAPLATGC
jgi:hypothetical protein